MVPWPIGWSAESVAEATTATAAVCNQNLQLQTGRARERGDTHGDKKMVDHIFRGDCTPFEYDGITRNKVFRFYSMFIKWYSVVIKCLLNGIR